MKTCYNCFNDIPDNAKTCPHCGSSADLRNWDKYPGALPCGTTLNGRYIIGRVLGQGGFGITYAGQQFDTKELIAIKEYFPDTMAARDASLTVIPLNTDRIEGFAYGKKQFLEEAETMAAFLGSPNIVRVHSYFEENGTAYFVMEYVRGKSLKQYVGSRGGRISWEETWDLLMPILEALSEVHSKKIIHRDIKPDNIIITEEGSAKLIDFGAARYKHGEKSRSLTAILTPGYAPPEQYYTKGDQGPWTDVYALAATMYFSITGEAPPESIERDRASKDSLERPSSLGIAIPAYAEAALLKALSVKEKERYETTYDFRNAVLEGKRREEKNREEKTGGATPLPPDQNDIIFRDTQKKAAAGDADAQYFLGYIYEKGIGTARNDKEAAKWYRLAAAQGNTEARMKLDQLSPGNGARQDPGGRWEGSSQEPVRDGNSQRAVRNGSSPGRVSGEPEGPPARRIVAAGEGPQDWKKDAAVGGPPSRRNITAGGGLQGGKKEPGTSKPVSRKNGDADRFSKIILAVGLIALILAAVLVLSNRNKGGEDEAEITTESTAPTTTETTPETTTEAVAPTTTETMPETTTEIPATTTTEITPETATETGTTTATTAKNAAPSQPEEEAKRKEPAQTYRTTDKPMELTDTWEEIAAAVHDGTYTERYRIGDTKELDMGSEGVITMKLVAMDEDELADGSGKAPMTWVADELLRSEHNMNSEDTNEGGWEASELRAWLRGTVLPLMPEEVRTNIREVTKYSYSYKEQKGVASKDTIWIPSVREVFPAGHNDWTDKGREKEGVSYADVFSNNEVRKRSREGESGASWWWLRSASYYYSHDFNYVYSDGDYYYDYFADFEGGVVVGFCF